LKKDSTGYRTFETAVENKLSALSIRFCHFASLMDLTIVKRFQKIILFEIYVVK